MGATEEQMQLLSDAGVTHVAYILMLYSIAFFLFLCKTPSWSLSFSLYTLTQDSVVNILLHLYAVHAFPESTKLSTRSRRTDSISSYTDINLEATANGHARSRSETQRIRDAEAFELEGLISEDEEDGSRPRVRKEADDDKEEGLGA